MNAKEKWILEVENSLDGLKPAEVNPYLYSKIINNLNTKAEAIPTMVVWGTAFSFVVLILLNIFVIKTGDTKHLKIDSEIQMVAKQYQLINDNNINYK
jgi:hypothetical protein